LDWINECVEPIQKEEGIIPGYLCCYTLGFCTTINSSGARAVSLLSGLRGGIQGSESQRRNLLIFTNSPTCEYWQISGNSYEDFFVSRRVVKSRMFMLPRLTFRQTYLRFRHLRLLQSPLQALALEFRFHSTPQSSAYSLLKRSILMTTTIKSPPDHGAARIA
jgi:hypothetical protein